MADVIVEKTDLVNAANVIREKLGTQDLMTPAEMADNISQIGGSPAPLPQPLDPEQVYRDTRPDDWLVMPEIGVNEDNVFYFLLMVDKDRAEDVPFNIIVGSDSRQTNTATWEFGATDSSGVFTPDSALTKTVTGEHNYYPQQSLPVSAFGNVTSEGEKQLLCKITATGNVTGITVSNGQSAGLLTRQIIAEFKGGGSQLKGIFAWGYTQPYGTANRLRYFNLTDSAEVQVGGLDFHFCYNLIAVLGLGRAVAVSGAQMFGYCRSLQAIPQLPRISGSCSEMFAGCTSLRALSTLDTSSSEGFSRMFENCTDLVVAPTMDTSKGLDFTYMFKGCSALRSVPQLNASRATSFAYMFSDCRELKSMPAMVASNGRDFSYMFSGCSTLEKSPISGATAGTNFSYMFSGCTSLADVPQFGTSSGTNFQSMFSSCASLATVSQLDTSSGTNFQGTFSSCTSLTAIPQLDTSSGVNFQSMFNGCRALRTIPPLDTSAGANFSYMFNGCSALTSIPLLDTSSGTSFYQMFYDCNSLKSIPLLDTSSGTSFSQMFSRCQSLEKVPVFDTSNGTNFQEMFSGCRALRVVPALDTGKATTVNSMYKECYHLERANFTGYDFSSLTGNNSFPGFIDVTNFGLTIEFGDKWPVNGMLTNSRAVSCWGSASADYPLRVKINKTDAMLPLTTNATIVFGNQSYVYVYVPDTLLATYQADTKWATLGTRLKGFSELPS